MPSKDYPRDISGLKVGKLTAIRLAERRFGIREDCWLCLCECGKETICTRSSLTNQQKRSCGCIRKETSKIGELNARPVTERFWENVAKGDKDDCWLWTRSSPNQYGRIDKNGRHILAHRLSYEIHTGETLTEADCICHSCDVPACVNPNHLWKGTRDKNNKDRAIKGRSFVTRGSLNHAAKLTEKDVVYILTHQNKFTRKTFQDKFGLTRFTLYDIIHRKTWRHVKV